ncbi:Core-binding (CB) domain-containing protein, partial [Dysosmobacter welbionis]
GAGLEAKTALVNEKRPCPFGHGRSVLFHHHIGLSQRLPGLLQQGLVEACMGAVDLAGVRHHHLHSGVAGKHLEHQLHVAHAGVVQAGELQVQHLIRRFPGLPFRRRSACGRERIRAVAEDLGRFLVPDGEPPLHHHCLVLLQVRPAGLQHPGEAQQLDGGGVVLHRHIGHQGVVAGGLRLAGGDDAADGDPLVVGEPCGAALLGEVPQNGADSGRPQPPHRLPVLVHGVAGEIEARGLLLHQHPFLGGVLVDVRQGDFLHILSSAAATVRQGEEIHLPLQVLAAAVRHRVH